MFTLEERIIAVERYINNGYRLKNTIVELGYPTKQALCKWYREYIDNGGKLHKSYVKRPKYSNIEKQNAVNYCIQHGRNISLTVKELGYPCRTVLSDWLIEFQPDEKKIFEKGTL